MSRRRGYIGLAVLGLVAAGLIVYALAAGALGYGGTNAADPCANRAPFAGEGFDATVQQIVLDGFDGAACELGTTREELVLSFDDQYGRSAVRWDRPTVERAVRAGMLRAVDDADERGSIGGLEARVLREAVQRAPIDLLIRGAGSLGELLDRVGLENLLDILGNR